MGGGCSVEHEANGGNVERSAANMEPQKSPVFIGQMASSYGGGGNSAPQGHCPGAPSTLPTPPCGGRTNNCQAKGEAQRLADKPETVTCNVTEYELTCKWEPRIVPKTCTVMVPQYKAVCAGNKLQATVQRTYQVDTRFDANQDGVIQQSEFEAARAAGGLQAIGNPTIVGGNASGGAGGGAAGGAQMFSGQMGGGAGGGGGGYGGGAQFGASGMQTGMQTGTGMASTFGASTGGMQSNFNMGMGGGQVGGMQPMMGGQMGGGGGYGN